MNKSFLRFPAILFALAPLCSPVPAMAQDEDSLGSIQVEGHRLPYDSRRPEYERMLPCIGCSATPKDEEGIVLSVLRFVLLPAEPPDVRAYTPIVLRQPADLRAERLP